MCDSGGYAVKRGKGGGSEGNIVIMLQNLITTHMIVNFLV